MSSSRTVYLGGRGVSQVAGLVAGLVLIVSGSGKWLAPTEFAARVVAYEILPASVVLGGVAGVAVAEILIGCLLLARPVAIASRLLATALLASFIFAQIWVLASGRVIECGCGLGSSQIGWNSLGKAFGLLVLASGGVGLCGRVVIDLLCRLRASEAADEGVLCR